MAIYFFTITDIQVKNCQHLKTSFDDLNCFYKIGCGKPGTNGEVCLTGQICVADVKKCKGKQLHRSSVLLVGLGMFQLF